MRSPDNLTAVVLSGLLILSGVFVVLPRESWADHDGFVDIFVEPNEIPRGYLSELIMIAVNITDAPFTGWNNYDQKLEYDTLFLDALEVNFSETLFVNSGGTVTTLVNCVDGVGTGCVAGDGQGIVHVAQASTVRVVDGDVFRVKFQLKDPSGANVLLHLLDGVWKVDAQPLPAALHDGVYQRLSCGDMIFSTRITLAPDLLDCPGTGIVMDAKSGGGQLYCNGHTISGTGAGEFGIWGIGGTDSPIIIGGCTVQNFQVGIRLELFSRQPYLDHNKALNNVVGFDVDTVSTWMFPFVGNEAHDNDIGFRMYNAVNLQLSENIARKNYIGFQFNQSASNTILRNTATDNRVGFVFDSSGMNRLERNTVENNSQIGFQLIASNGNGLIGNVITNNTAGVELASSSQNSIYGNNFNNTVNARDDGINSWNRTTTTCIYNLCETTYSGNFWHDYLGADKNGDGFGDTLIPYNSGGGIVDGGDFTPIRWPLHEVGVMALTLPRDVWLIGEVVRVDVTIQNWGTFTENFNVTITANEIEIGFIGLTLSPALDLIMTFYWNTTLAQAGGYAIRAVASSVLGELYTANNELVYGTIQVQSALIVVAGSPVDLYIIDPLGRAVGVDPNTNQEISQIPGATYSGRDAQPETITIANPAEGNYQVTVLGTGSGSYRLTLRNGPASHSFSGNTTSGQRDNYTLDAGLPSHDVAVTGITLSRNLAYSGVPSNPIRVYVAVANPGASSETFLVTTSANGSITGNQVVTLAAGSTAVVSFDWNANLLTIGRYVLSAEASVSGEVDLSDNILTYGVFEVRKAGDVDADGDVDINDLISVWLNQFTSSIVHDLDNDGDVDLEDLITTWLHQFT